MTKQTSTQNAKHTPGPWHVGEQQDGYNVVYAAKDSELDGAWIAMTRNADDSFMSINGDADARLVAASPDLLAAAKRAKDALSGYGVGSTNYEVFIALSEAINKAESR